MGSSLFLQQAARPETSAAKATLDRTVSRTAHWEALDEPSTNNRRQFNPFPDKPERTHPAYDCPPACLLHEQMCSRASKSASQHMLETQNVAWLNEERWNIFASESYGCLDRTLNSTLSKIVLAICCRRSIAELQIVPKNETRKKKEKKNNYSTNLQCKFSKPRKTFPSKRGAKIQSYV
jgi:hypothetical protein